MASRSAAIFVLLLLQLIALSTAQISPSPIPSGVRVSAKRGIAVAGISSGGFFAVQYQVAYSSYLKGAGVIAGGPFYCAQDSITNALTSCTSLPSGITTSTLVSAAQACADGNVCDGLGNLTSHNMWLFSGTGDTVVNPGVMQKLVDFYQGVGANNIQTEFTVPAEHSWITDNFGNQCGTLSSPYMNNCDYNAASNITNTVFGPMKSGMPANNSHVFYMDQSKYTPNGESPSSISLGDQAFVYVPHGCQSPMIPCRLVIAFHGCEQTTSDIGYDMVLFTGLNEMAVANNLVILYPQAIRSDFSPSNPNGCWDWWGYTDSNYSNNQGVQMQTVFNMMQQLRAGTP